MIRALAIAISFVALSSGVALAQHVGVVFDDANESGSRDGGEIGRAGVAVTNGRDVVVSGADGRYELPEAAAGFVSITCPADARCPVWFHRASEGGSDFAVVRASRSRSEDFFFVHMSDVHAYPKVEDMASLLPEGGIPWWLPRNLAGWVLLWSLSDRYPPHTRDEIAGHLREIVAKHKDVDSSWNSTVMMDYLDLALDPWTGIVQPGVEIPRALAEVESLAPSFVINTGDLVFEGNSGDADSVERWFEYYVQVAVESGLEIRETIGNNELGGTDNEDFLPSDPRYGKALFRKHFGPTHYSFDRGPFHFVALDTHRRNFEPGQNEEWSFNDMEPEVRSWLDADLAAAVGRVLVVLNHEPFHEDPAWGFEGDVELADDEGLFEKHDVAYVLAGHIHRNGMQDAPRSGGTTHITTGALSGFRWALPTSFDSRGYRLVYAHDGRLYSAWKDLGQPLLGFVDPKGAAAIHPASSFATDPAALSGDSSGSVSIVAVAADVAGPFARVELLLDGERVETSRWGDYFVHARVLATRVARKGSVLMLRATGEDGGAHEARLDVHRSAD